jgi:hypothetical protein
MCRSIRTLCNDAPPATEAEAAKAKWQGRGAKTRERLLASD